jgi:ATP-binding cassette, subfamily C (CFTR/MRP), member 1
LLILATAALLCLIQISLIAYGAKYLATLVPVTLAVVCFLQRYYLRTSRQLRLLDLELKSPLYTSLTETLEGLATIRAFGWQSAFEQKFQAKIDSSQRAVYLLYMIQRWLNFVLDCIVAALAILLMTFATQMRSSSSAATFGVGLVSVIGFGQNLSQFIFYYTELETFLGAVARTKQWVDEIKPEDSGSGDERPSKDWPTDGAIQFQDVTAVYKQVKAQQILSLGANDLRSREGTPALSGVSISIKAGQKVCICGRSGSGKSTLMSALLRIIDVQSGSICVDGVNVSTIGAEIVRQSVTAIPQSPFFLPGSVRLNLTLSNDESDELPLTAALQKAGIWEIISVQGGLGVEMSAISLSHGQQQLFCLARAMLKKSKIMIMDEATSGFDQETEELMEHMIAEEFRDSTVISIAHRLKMARNCDLVVVLSQGTIVEMGEPSKLLQDRGEFWQLWQAQS